MYVCVYEICTYVQDCMYVCRTRGCFIGFFKKREGFFFFCVFKVNRVVNIYIYRLVESFHTSCIVEKEVAVLRTEISRVIFGY